MKKRSLVFKFTLISLLVLAILMSGCSTQTAKDETLKQDKQESPAAKKSKFPEGPITFIIPYSPGGGSDLTGRLLANLMEEDLGVKVNPVNIAGGSGVKGLAELAKSKPDGYTILVITSSLSALKPMGRSEYSSKDFETVGMAQAEAYALAVAPNSPYKTFQDIIDAAKSGKKINVGTTAVGGNNYLAAAVTGKAAKVKFNLIPFGDGAAGAVTDLASGTLDAAYASPSEFKAQRDAGKVRLLMVTAEERVDALSDVPTLKELGYDVSFETVRVILAPKGTPADRIEVLTKAIKKATESEKFIEFMKNAGSSVRYKNPQATREFVNQQDNVYAELITELGLQAK
ncbi:tripartite tricarboxylate transporter substrate binding protein [Tepidibacillus sp. HK-1]|uniref:tripartite tricarboxylate transporter substrate binding protein n=1 Tax=Tepidibacillus sp. HK-1 TaxID=1883407 RepID=UPI000852CA25|nr:tripartite tricarboxylate transporter substrate binding protein [Tepidibacillus sp. HK-1]GBF12233.1 tripartite tricarboxylate transporter family receptor [Tepidibacillus sp. HK-1]